MASRLRKLASETAVYGISSILARAVSFLLFPFYSNVFRPDEYGPVIVVFAAFVFLNILYQYGMESAYLKFAADATDPDGRRSVFSTAFWSLVLSSTVFSALLWLGRGTAAPVIGLSPEWEALLGYAAAILWLDTLAVVPFAELRLSNRPWRFAVVRVTNVVVNVALNVTLIVGYGMGIEAVLIANVAASAVTILLLAPVLRASLVARFDRPAWAAMFAFALPFVPGGLGYATTETINRFFLAGMDPDRVLALYGPSMPPDTVATIRAGGVAAASDFVVGAYGGIVKLAVLMALGAQMFRYAWQPFFLQHAKDADARELFGRVFVLLTAVIGGVLLATSFFAAELVAIPLPGGRHLVDPAYWIALPIVPVALVGYAFQAWYYQFSAGAYLANVTRYFVPCTLAGSAVAVLVNAALVPGYGMVAAAWATSLAYATMALALLALVQRVYHVPYPWPRVIGIVAAAAMLVTAWLVIPDLAVWPMELALCAVYALVAWRLCRV